MLKQTNVQILIACGLYNPLPPFPYHLGACYLTEESVACKQITTVTSHTCHFSYRFSKKIFKQKKRTKRTRKAMSHRHCHRRDRRRAASAAAACCSQRVKKQKRDARDGSRVQKTKGWWWWWDGWSDDVKKARGEEAIERLTSNPLCQMARKHRHLSNKGNR